MQLLTFSRVHHPSLNPRSFGPRSKTAAIEKTSLKREMMMVITPELSMRMTKIFLNKQKRNDVNIHRLKT